MSDGENNDQVSDGWPPQAPDQQSPASPFPPQQFPPAGQPFPPQGQQFPPQQFPPVGQQFPPPPAGQAPYGSAPYPPPPPGAGYGQPMYQPYGQPYGVGAVPNPYDSRGTTIMVIGILGLTVCQVLAFVAFFMGRSLKAEAEAAGWPEPGTAKAGRICGLVGMCVVGFFVVVYGLFIIAMVVGSNA